MATVYLQYAFHSQALKRRLRLTPTETCGFCQGTDICDDLGLALEEVIQISGDLELGPAQFPDLISDQNVVQTAHNAGGSGFRVPGLIKCNCYIFINSFPHSKESK